MTNKYLEIQELEGRDILKVVRYNGKEYVLFNAKEGDYDLPCYVIENGEINIISSFEKEVFEAEENGEEIYSNDYSL